MSEWGFVWIFGQKFHLFQFLCVNIPLIQFSQMILNWRNLILINTKCNKYSPKICFQHPQRKNTALKETKQDDQDKKMQAR